MDPMHHVATDRWTREVSATVRRDAVTALENGKLVFLPELAFTLGNNERRFLSPVWASRRTEHITLDGERLRGAQALSIDQAALRAILIRYRAQASELVCGLFPAYAPHLKRGRTTYRPFEVRRGGPYKRDDTRLHVDAFASHPLNGERILRVFSNINPDQRPRIWRVGEPFESVARHFLPRIRRPLPGVARLLDRLGITRGRRSEYDHLMLALHDRMKADLLYQAGAPFQQIALRAGSTWLAFTDQVVHAAISGQFVLEQTFRLPVHALANEATAPLRILERLTQRPLPLEDSVPA